MRFNRLTDEVFCIVNALYANKHRQPVGFYQQEAAMPFLKLVCQKLKEEEEVCKDFGVCVKSNQIRLHVYSNQENLPAVVASCCFI